jgi:succinyl-CoA synthetase beta subunit
VIIHEYQAKQIFREAGIPVLPGGVASSAEDAADIARKLDTDRWIVKAQIHAGGRAAGRFENASTDKGGVRRAKSVEEVRGIARDMLNKVLVTPQTGPSGREVKRIYVEKYSGDIQRELYLAMLVDGRTSQLMLIASAAGGQNVESTGTDFICKVPVNIHDGIGEAAIDTLAAQLGLDPALAQEMSRIARAVFDLFIAKDASLIEINPLAVNSRGDLVALDATITLDDNALFRHEDMEKLRDRSELRIGELEAARHGLNYVKLDGNIGCLASGAGLSLATIDAIKLIGGEPANFLDVPPVAEVERVRQAFRLVLSDPGVDSVLVNVFGGGIMRCDTIADALIMVNRDTRVAVPLVVRLAGTNANFGMRRLKDMGPKLTFADDLADAAEKAVAAATKKEKAVRRNWWERVMGTEQ